MLQVKSHKQTQVASWTLKTKNHIVLWTKETCVLKDVTFVTALGLKRKQVRKTLNSVIQSVFIFRRKHWTQPDKYISWRFHKRYNSERKTSKDVSLNGTLIFMFLVTVKYYSETYWHKSLVTCNELSVAQSRNFVLIILIARSNKLSSFKLWRLSRPMSY